MIYIYLQTQSVMRIIARSKVVEYYTEHPGETFRTSWVSPSRVSDYLTGRCEQPWFSTGCIVRSLSPNRAVVEAWSSGRLSRIVRSFPARWTDIVKTLSKDSRIPLRKLWGRCACPFAKKAASTWAETALLKQRSLLPGQIRKISWIYFKGILLLTAAAELEEADTDLRVQ